MFPAAGRLDLGARELATRLTLIRKL